MSSSFYKKYIVKLTWENWKHSNFTNYNGDSDCPEKLEIEKLL